MDEKKCIIIFSAPSVKDHVKELLENAIKNLTESPVYSNCMVPSYEAMIRKLQQRTDWIELSEEEMSCMKQAVELYDEKDSITEKLMDRLTMNRNEYVAKYGLSLV